MDSDLAFIGLGVWGLWGSGFRVYRGLIGFGAYRAWDLEIRCTMDSPCTPRSDIEAEHGLFRQ